MLLGLLLSIQESHAQEILELEEAINIALENNYDIRLEKYNVQIQSNNVSRAVAGQMPRVDLTAGYEYGYSDAEIITRGQGEGTNPPLELDGTSQDITFKNQVTVPIFTGFAGKYRYKQLESSRTMSEVQLAAVVEQSLASTVTNYLQVARFQSRLHILEENIAQSQDRLERVTIDTQYGAANSILRLQAEVNLNNDSATYRNAVLNYDNSKRDLNLLLGLSDNTNFTVQENILLVENMDYAELENAMLMANKQLLLSNQLIDQATYNVKISESSLFPTIQGYANINYLDTEDEASFLQNNTVFGPNVGVNLSLPIFTGGAQKIQRQNAKVSLEQQRLSKANTEAQLKKELQNAFAQYENNRAQLRIEQANLETFETNYTKSKEDFGYGLIDSSDLRQAQINLANAKNRINDLTYNVKQSEIRLLQLSGQLQTSNEQL